MLRISEKVDDERSAREEHVGAVRSDLDAVKAKDTAEADAFESLVLSDLAAIKNALNEEKRERVGEDERIVGALNAYARVRGKPETGQPKRRRVTEEANE